MNDLKVVRDHATPNDLLEALDAAGYRMTGSRRAIVELIGMRDGIFDAGDLVADAQRRKVATARSTIFRTLELLAELGLVERLDLPNGDHSYVVCDPRRHHHHLVCSHCHRSVDLEDLGMTPIMAEVERRTGYQIDRHRVELFGLCPSCQHRRHAEG